MEDIFIIQALFGFSMALFEVPSAYLGDLWGRKNVLVLGSFITGIGFTCLLFAHDFWSLLLYEILLGIGASFVSGADIAILYDSIGDNRELKTKTLSHLQGMQLIGEAVAALCCSFLMVYGFNGVIWAQVFVGWIPLVVSFGLIEPEIIKMDKNAHKENIKEVIKYIFQDDKFLRVIFINMVVWSLSTFFAVWIIQKYWQDQNIALEHLGYLWMICNLTAAATGKFATKLEKILGSIKLLLIMALMPVVAYITMGSFIGSVGVYFTLLFYVSRGLNMVIMREAFNHRIPSKFRNTANSLSSLFFRMGFFVFGPLVGYIIDKKGMSFALNSIGYFFLLLIFIVLVPMLNMIHKQKRN
jgi:MFS family permease